MILKLAQNLPGANYLKSLVSAVFLYIVLALPAVANSVIPPDDPRQSITYWKQHAISPEKDSLAAMAKNVFTVLLQGWDSSRLEPGLYVVNSTAGPWAASLADGNILLSRAAIESCLKFGKQRAEHLLAFVLAHELAHQRSDDLWHQRFFRLVGKQGGDIKHIVDADYKKNKNLWNDISQKENQADHDGLIMMASVGYDPYQVVDKKDFFTVWVENIWQASCASQKTNPFNSKACAKAKDRAVRARAQLTAIATQSTLYDMGLQAFVAGRYTRARHYFTAYGRDYTNRAVLSAIGQTHFAEALQYHKQLVSEYGWSKPVYYYPFLLDSSAAIYPHNVVNQESNKRASLSREAEKLRNKMQHHIRLSVEYYEKAIRLAPDYARTYLLLAFSYLLDNNPYMVRGIIQGKYIPRFGNDQAVKLVLAMTRGVEGDIDKTLSAFSQLTDQPDQFNKAASISTEALVYSAYFNHAAYIEYLGRNDEAQSLWKEMADYAKHSAQPVLFQLAIKHVNKQQVAASKDPEAISVNGVRLGDKRINKKAWKRISDLWIEGEKYKVFRLSNGGKLIVAPDRRVVNAWQDTGKAKLASGLRIGDTAIRTIQVMGTPDRSFQTISGQYLAYDSHGLAIHLMHQQVAGWFLYQAK